MATEQSFPGRVHIAVHGSKSHMGMCFTDRGEPAVFLHPEDAELFVANRRTQYPEVTFGVLDSVVL